jgi:hypothetical protein
MLSIFSSNNKRTETRFTSVFIVYTDNRIMEVYV